MDLAYTIKTEKPYEEVVEKLQTVSQENQFRVLAVHNVQATLEEKGFKRGPLSIVEVCNAGFAHEALQKDINVSLFMPCKISVYTDNNQTVLTLARPEMISEMLPGVGLDEMASDVEKRLKNIMALTVE